MSDGPVPDQPRSDRDMTVTVLVADDQELVRTGFRMILDAEPDIDVVGEASTGAEAVRTALDLRPDIILMDIRMPTLDGIAATRLLAERGQLRTSRVLILTTFDLDEYVFDAIQAGASGFLLKDTPANQLASAVRMVAAGDALIAPTITRRLIEGIRCHSPAGLDTPRLRRPDPQGGRNLQADRQGTIQLRDRQRANHRRDHSQNPCDQKF